MSLMLNKFIDIITIVLCLYIFTGCKSIKKDTTNHTSKSIDASDEPEAIEVSALEYSKNAAAFYLIFKE
ncbi:MAG: hypothetical protein KBD78_11545 [Oligoflexales bacterium]|nr:hypothetical protein [Oligoflexales bacterium]